MRARILQRLALEDSPALTPLFLDRLSEDEVDVVRVSAASALARRLDEPGVRAALERTAAQDPLPRVRAVATRILEGGI